MKLVPDHEKWFREGIAEHQKFLAAFRSAKEAAFNAGLYFLSAKAAHKHGEFEQFADLFREQVSVRSVRRYMEFSTECLEWAKSDRPDLKSLAKLQDHARALVLQSPKGMVALCRELQLMRKFGEYDAVKYARNKTSDRDEPQLFFSFEEFESALQPLVRNQAPQLKDLAVSSLQKLEADLAAAAATVREELAQRGTGSTRASRVASGASPEASTRLHLQPAA